MKKKRITYGVLGMMEYQCIIRFGKNTLKVTFTGGSMNAIGVTPATFTTNSFFLQQAIENSTDYKRGRIRIVSEIDLDEEVRIEHPMPASVPQPTPQHTAPEKPVNVPVAKPVEEIVAEQSDSSDESDLSDISEAVKDAPAAIEEAPAAAPDTARQPAPEVQAEEGEVKAMTEVEFSCNEDAKDYLEQNFGVARSKCRTRNEIIAQGRLHHVAISFEQ